MPLWRAAPNAARYQRNLRHTTHHQDLPERVTVTRVCHPFEGKALAVWQSIRRQGRTYLVLILPDGSKSMIPVEWTDLATPAASKPDTVPTLASLEDLLHTRAVVDALFSRLPAFHIENRNRAAGKESTIAKESEPLRSSSRRNVALGDLARRTQNGGHRSPGTHHR